jgi:hypothetical protein
MIRCKFKMPDNDLIEPGGQCVKFADHGSVHVVALTTRGAITYWQINSRKHTLRMIYHADLRDGSIPSDEECMTLYHYLRSLKAA